MNDVSIQMSVKKYKELLSTLDMAIFSTGILVQTIPNPMFNEFHSSLKIIKDTLPNDLDNLVYDLESEIVDTKINLEIYKNLHLLLHNLIELSAGLVKKNPLPVFNELNTRLQTIKTVLESK